MKIYNNQVTLHSLVGGILASTSFFLGMVWIGSLADPDLTVIDFEAFLWLGMTAGWTAVTVQFWRKIKIARILASLLLHCLSVILAVCWIVGLFEFQTVFEKYLVTGLCFPLIGIFVFGILALHSFQMKQEFQND